MTNRKASAQELARRLSAAEQKLADAEQDLAAAIASNEGDRVIRSCRETVRRQRVRVSNLRTDIKKMRG